MSLLKENQEYRRFESSLVNLLEETPIEDGMSHPIEKVLDSVFTNHPQNAYEWVEQAVNNYFNKPAICAGIISGLSRIENSPVPEWEYSLAERCLSKGGLEVRDAAVCALEHWGSQKSIEILSKHQEKVSWLADYISRVIQDLKDN